MVGDFEFFHVTLHSVWHGGHCLAAVVVARVSCRKGGWVVVVHVFVGLRRQLLLYVCLCDG